MTQTRAVLSGLLTDPGTRDAPPCWMIRAMGEQVGQPSVPVTRGRILGACTSLALNWGLSLGFLYGTDGSKGDTWMPLAIGTFALTLFGGIALKSRGPWRAFGEGLVWGTLLAFVPMLFGGLLLAGFSNQFA